MHTELNMEKARQGHTGDGGRYVLGIGLVGVILAMIGVVVLF